MREQLNFSDILSIAEQQVFLHHHEWRWVSTLTKPDLKPARRPPKFSEHAAKYTHAPQQRELFLTLSGDTQFILGDQIYRATPGVVIMFNRRERHDWDVLPWNSSKPFRHLWLHISNHHVISSNLNEVDADCSRKDSVLKFISGHNPQLMMALWDRCERQDTFSPIHWEFLKTVITASFFESVSDWQNNASTKPQQLVVNSVCEHIRKNLDKELTLESLSRFAGYSPYFLHRIFLRHIGQPLHRYVVEARLERAKALLTAGQSVSEVSDRVGMPSPSYFSRFFKKHTLVTPNWWREVHQVQK